MTLLGWLVFGLVLLFVLELVLPYPTPCNWLAMVVEWLFFGGGWWWL